MTLNIVSAEISGMRGVIVISGETADELRTMDMKKAVLQEAQVRGLNRAGLSNEPTVYPVNKDGKPFEALTPGNSAVCYHAEYKLAGGI